MNQLNALRKKQEVKEIALLRELYDNRSNRALFVNIPYKCPYCVGGDDDEAIEERFRYHKQFETYFLFWERADNYLLAPELREAVYAYIKTKSELVTDENYQEIKVNLIKEIEKQYLLRNLQFKQKYNNEGKIKLKWRLRYLLYVLSGTRWMRKREVKCDGKNKCCSRPSGH